MRHRWLAAGAGRFVREVLSGVAFAVGCAGLALPGVAGAQDAAALKAKHASLAEKFANNPFGRPLVLDSTQTSDGLRGDVYTVVEHPYATVKDALQSIDHWCDILILHLNVKRCRVGGGG